MPVGVTRFDYNWEFICFWEKGGGILYSLFSIPQLLVTPLGDEYQAPEGKIKRK